MMQRITGLTVSGAIALAGCSEKTDSNQTVTTEPAVQLEAAPSPGKAKATSATEVLENQVVPTSPKELAELLHAAFVAGKVDSIRGFVTSSTRLKIARGEARGEMKPMGAPVVLQTLWDTTNPIPTPQIVCKGACCKFAGAEIKGNTRHYLTEVCFSGSGRSGTLKIKKIGWASP